jgi:NTP pyrophosphatase (non-canonical NTP hydrolase)
MKDELLNYIEQLSLKDKKTLSQKALKVAEESGELAKVILPLENAPGTIHRFVDKNKALEEAVDVILTAISIPYDMGYTHEEIQEAMWHKAEKWQNIQSKEENFNETKIPFEIHVTVSANNMKEKLGREVSFSVDYFKEICQEIGVKPIVLDLENSGESVMQDVMTSSKVVGDNSSAIAECKRISKELKEAGFEVIREKIETVPFHPYAPQKEGEEMPGGCYFEAHIGCIISPEQKDTLQDVANMYGAHLSRNFFKKLDEGKFINMITLRSYDYIYSDFESEVTGLKGDLKTFDIEYEKVITEFAIYDTKVSHDFLWTKAVEA